MLRVHVLSHRMRPTINSSEIGLSNPPLTEDISSNFGNGVASVAPSPQENSAERGTRKNAPEPAEPTESILSTKDAEHWFVVWATRGRIPEASEFYQQNGVSTFAPIEKVTVREDGKLRHKEVYILKNILFVFTSQKKINQLISDNPFSPFTCQLRDRTIPNDSNRYPPMIIPITEMENFIRECNSGDPNFQKVDDPSRLKCKGEGEYLVIKGCHTGVKGMRVRYKKQDRIATKLGNWIFVSGYIPDSFVRPYMEQTGESLFEPTEISLNQEI